MAQEDFLTFEPVSVTINLYEMATRRRIPPLLLIGDGLALLAVTMFGFSSHDLNLLNPRWLSTFVPLILAWALLGPWFGVFRPEVYGRAAQTWRVVLAMLLAAPLAAWLRGVWLGTAIQPLFVAIIGGVAAAGLGVWRIVWAWIGKRAGAYG